VILSLWCSFRILGAYWLFVNFYCKIWDKQRAQEWIDQAEHLKENIKQGKLYVKDGVVYDAIAHKPFTGDIDIFDIRGVNGQKLPKATIQHVVDELKLNHNFSSIEHGAHVEWDWKSIKDPNDRRIAREIYDKIVLGHMSGKEALVEFSPKTGAGTPPTTVYYDGGI